MGHSPQAIIVGITGASGTVYGLRLVEVLLKAGYPVHLLITAPGRLVASMEDGLNLPARPEEIGRRLLQRYGDVRGELHVFGENDWRAPMASGSSGLRHMAVCPCTMATLSAVATGASRNLLERAADVILKERGNLVLVPRETPLNAIHLEHMLGLARMGTVILPPCPGFYHRPESITDLVDFVVARVLDQLGVEHELGARWPQPWIDRE
ncbi:MAG TPA: flavin prenyltransferase UbiX [Gammaproteobacteria bacterium]|nr:flavin prenyltransferase UbiX [Gammaproteobacteria bacterium]